jgi:hypothetical protein
MYTIIGGDGREYGPVTADQVRSWIAAGRANRDTRAKALGSDTWKTLADFQEFFGPAPAGGEAAPAPVSAPASALQAPPQRPSKLDIASCYERSWSLLKANFWPLFGASLLMSVIYGALGYSMLQGIFVVTPLFGGVLIAGMYYFILRRIRGQRSTAGDLFAGFTRGFVSLFVAGILFSVIVTVALFCLVIPGIYLIVAYTFTWALAVDKGLGFWEALETSRKVVTRQWWGVLGLLLLGIPFLLLGAAALGVGVFVAIPLVLGAVAYAYEDLCNTQA